MIVPVFLALSHLLMFSNGQSVIGTRFIKETMLCDVTGRLTKGCSEEVAGVVISRIECVALCGRQESCLGASLDDQGKCFLHRECLGIGNECNSVEDTTSHRYLAKYCGLGTWDGNTQSCKCVRGMHGVRCDKYPKDCWALFHYETRLYRVVLDPHQNGRNLYVIGCRVFSSSDVIHFLAISHGVKSFNRTWEEYGNGFYTDETHMWAGLELWHLLCKDGCKVFVVWSFTSSAAVFRWHNNFVVSNASSYYEMNYNSSHAGSHGPLPTGATIHDCFAPLKGRPFSTWDQDSDGEDTVNCAARAGSGWWYGETGVCANPCHMLGLGFDYWNTATPSEQLLSFQGVDMDSLISKVVSVEIYIGGR